MSLLQKWPFGRAENPQNRHRFKKCDFFKVWDNDTPIQPGEKEGQTDVSSALKRFYDHLSRFWENLIFRFFVTTLTILLGFLYRNGQTEVKKSKKWDFLKYCSGGRKTFLGPS